ncbi:MAG: hypothetical protein IPG81_23185 [Sandaracinaceae bacterium]|nr:hypothetical protein [Sandaracinaceae bacterium]
MTQASTTRRARLDALLDQGGLEQASAADRAWLTAERARDAGFDREVAALLRAEAHLREWGGLHTGAGQGPDEALAGIFAGLDAGLFDDGLELDGAPQFADGEGDVVGLAARAAASPVTVAAEAPAAAAATVVPLQAKPRPTLLRDGRFMQLLAAAAAVVLVVTAGLSAVSTSSPDSSEGAAARQPSAPAPTAAPMLVMPSEPAAVQASPAAEAEDQFFRDPPAEERATLAAAPAAQRPMAGAQDSRPWTTFSVRQQPPWHPSARPPGPTWATAAAWPPRAPSWPWKTRHLRRCAPRQRRRQRRPTSPPVPQRPAPLHGGPTAPCRPACRPATPPRPRCSRPWPAASAPRAWSPTRWRGTPGPCAC